MTTLKDIRVYMIDSMSHYNPKDNGEYYDEDGHCGDGLWVDIQNFWKGFSTDDDFKYLVSGEWFGDELDLEGGRSYLLDEELCKMCFNYMYKTLGWSSTDYDNVIWNTCDFTEDIQHEYDSISVKRDEKINQIIKPSYAELYPEQKKVSLEEKQLALEKLYPTTFQEEKEGDVDYIPIVIKYHKSRREELDTYDSIEYLDKSRSNEDFICYKIKSLGVKIPKGYEIVKPVEDILYADTNS